MKSVENPRELISEIARNNKRNKLRLLRNLGILEFMFNKLFSDSFNFNEEFWCH